MGKKTGGWSEGPKTAMDEEYMSLMAELGEGPVPTPPPAPNNSSSNNSKEDKQAWRNNSGGPNRMFGGPPRPPRPLMGPRSAPPPPPGKLPPFQGWHRRPAHQPRSFSFTSFD